MKRLFVTGGSGLLGSSLVRLAASTWETSYGYARHPWRYEGAEAAQLDVTDRRSVFECLETIRPAVIIHTAALRSMDYCEEHQARAMAVNVLGTRHVAEVARCLNAFVVHISTDSVFDGKRGLYQEHHPTHPLNVYGQTKRLAEQALQEALGEDQYLIARTSTIFGRSLFAQNLVEWIIGQLDAGKSIEMLTDSYFSPTLSENLSAALLDLIESETSGLLHVAGPDRCSRYELAKSVARAFSLNEDLVKPITLREARSQFKAQRLKDSSLDASKAQARLGVELLSLEEGLNEFRRSRDEHRRVASVR